MGGLSRSPGVDFHDSVGEGLRCFLWQVMPDTARDGPVRICAGEFVGIRTGVRVWCAIGIALERHGWDRDHWTRGKLVLQIVILRVAVSQRKSPAIVMDHDVDMIWIV